ncbi:MAG: hypothetical protein IJZ64_08150 [Ruminococcus sp.]|nr:hypothetical protein [Ruminococcus sp.]
MHPKERDTNQVSKKADNTEKEPKKRKSFSETIKDIDEKQRQQEEALEERRQKIIAERRKREQQAYEERIKQEKIELIRLKQGVIEESEIIPEISDEKVKLPFGKRIYNFFYHNKWWLWITLFLVALGIYLIVDLVTRVKPDLAIMILTDNENFQMNTQAISEYFEQFTEDENGDGKVNVSIYAIPVTDNINTMDYYTGDATLLSMKLQEGESVMIITDTKANAYINGDEILAPLNELYPNNKNIREYGYYLRNTDFAEKIGYSDDDGLIDRDICISLRAVKDTRNDSVENMQKNYDIAKKVLERVMEDLDNTEPQKN